MMMLYVKHVVTKALMLILSLAILFPQSAHAEDATVKSSPPVGALYDWFLDEAHGYIYLIGEKKVTFLSVSDLKFMKVISLNSNVTNIATYGDRLYLSSDGKINVINIPKLQLENSISIKSSLKEFVVDKDKIIYTIEGLFGELYGHKLFEYNMVSKKNTEVQIPNQNEPFLYEPSIAIDSRNHILLIAEPKGNGEIRAIKTTDYQIVSKIRFSDNPGLKSLNSRPKVIFDQGDLFIGYYRLDGQNLQSVKGSYNSEIKAVYGKYVVTDKGIYDRNTFTEIGTVEADILIDRFGYVYYYTVDNKIGKERWDLSLVLDGYYEHEDGQLSFYYNIVDFVYDHSNNRIYAISREENKLYFIDPESLEVEHEMFIGSNPTDIELYNGEIYVALTGATKVAVTSVSYNGKVEHILLDRNPIRIAVGKTKLFFTSGDGFKMLSAYDFSKGTIDKNILNIDSAKPDLYFDRDRQMLYVGETGSSASPLFAISAEDLTKINKSNHNDGRGFPSPRKLSVYEDELYFSEYIIDADDLNNVKNFTLNGGKPIHDEHIISVTNSHVFSNEYIYDKTTQKMVSELPFRVSFLESDANGAYYIYGVKNRILKKYDSLEELAADWPLFDEDSGAPPIPYKMSNYFPDDLEDHWAAEPMLDFLSADLLTGYKNEDGSISLRPNQQISRAEFVTILVRALGLEGEQGSKSFKDVKYDSWYHNAVLIAHAHGIVQGRSETEFAPERPIKRDEMAAIIVRAFESSIDFNGKAKVFRDVPSYWATDFINKANSAGIIEGISDDRFKPSAKAKRSESIVMLYRALHKESSDLPSDDELKNIALLFEREMLQAYGKDITKEREIVVKYTTGYYYVRSDWNVDYRKSLMAEGIEINSVNTNELSAVVIDKSNRLAVVELKGAIYKTEYKKGHLSRTSTQDTSGVLYMRKMPTGDSWKIYNVNLPNINE
ncbi:MAG: S-layer homology domain-containing protein [Bacillota bacterium]